MLLGLAAQQLEAIFDGLIGVQRNKLVTHDSAGGVRRILQEIGDFLLVGTRKLVDEIGLLLFGQLAKHVGDFVVGKFSEQLAQFLFRKAFEQSGAQFIVEFLHHGCSLIARQTPQAGLRLFGREPLQLVCQISRMHLVR